MKRLFGLVLMLALVCVPAFAAKNSESLTLMSDVTVGSTKIQAGDYKVTWTGTAPSVEVSLMLGNKAVATAPATLVEQKHDSLSKGVSSINQSGTQVLREIRLNNITLTFGDAKP